MGYRSPAEQRKVLSPPPFSVTEGYLFAPASSVLLMTPGGVHLASGLKGNACLNEDSVLHVLSMVLVYFPGESSHP